MINERLVFLGQPECQINYNLSLTPARASLLYASLGTPGRGHTESQFRRRRNAMLAEHLSSSCVVTQDFIFYLARLKKSKFNPCICQCVKTTEPIEMGPGSI